MLINQLFMSRSWTLLNLQVIDEYDENVHFVEIDIEEDPEVAEAAGIMGTPCVQFFKNKEMIRLVALYSSYIAILYLVIVAH